MFMGESEKALRPFSLSPLDVHVIEIVIVKSTFAKTSKSQKKPNLNFNFYNRRIH